MDRHITIILSVLTSLLQELLETVVREAIFKKKNSQQFCDVIFPPIMLKFQKLKKHMILKNDEFYIIAKVQANCLKTQKVVYTSHFFESFTPTVL